MNLDRLLVKAKGLETDQWYVGDFHRFKSHYYNDEGHDCYINHYTVNGRNIDPDTICQCTGMKDQNGKLIFEGDVVGFEDEYEIDFCVKTYTQKYEVAFYELSFHFSPFVMVEVEEDVWIRDEIGDAMIGMDMINNDCIEGVYMYSIHDKEDT